MKSLEMKIPPVILLLICLGLIAILADAASISLFTTEIRFALWVGLTSIAVAVCLSGVLQFKSNQTTVNPMNPESTSRLVQNGVYRFTRNPMYLGFTIFLFACALYFSSVGSFFVVPAFVLYMTIFQIKPEEKALLKLFGEEYTTYKNKVRRWA